MRFLVFSDSHAKLLPMQKVIQMHTNDVEGVFHLGDGIREVLSLKETFPNINITAVLGNCDSAMYREMGYREEEHFALEGHRILLTHGFRDGVKYSTEALKQRAISEGYDIALFGHTHRALFQYMPAEGENSTGIFLCNPGTARESFGLLEFGSFGVDFHVVPFADVLNERN